MPRTQIVNFILWNLTNSSLIPMYRITYLQNLLHEKRRGTGQVGMINNLWNICARCKNAKKV